jgi:hypothetical protein
MEFLAETLMDGVASMEVEQVSFKKSTLIL